jgi:prephenate dehydrogenase
MRDKMFVEHQALTSTAMQLVDAHFRTLIQALQKGDDPKAAIDALKDAGYKPSDIVRLFKEAEKADRDLVIARAENAKEAQEQLERLAESHADEMAALYRELLDELHLTPEQQEIAETVVRRQLVGTAEEEK